MSDPIFGIGIQRVEEEGRPAVEHDMSTVGLVGTAPNADVGVFPINTPVHLYSDDEAMLTKLGTGGTLPAAIRGVNDQLGEMQAAARIVVVRIAVGVDDAATMTNIIGNSLTKTGMFALLLAGTALGVVPRLIGIPGFTSQHETDDGEANVNSAAKTGGNTGNGAMTLATPAYGPGVKHGVYTVRAKGGAHAGVSAAKPGGNTGNGVLSALTAAGGSVVDGVYKVRFSIAAVNGGTYVVTKPDGSVLGAGVVGTPFTSTHIGFSIADGATDFIVGDGFDITVSPSIPANGGVFSVTDPDGIVLPDATVGTPYGGNHVRFTIADGSTDFVIGDGFDVTATITSGTALANPVVAALPPLLEKLLAHAVVSGPATSEFAFKNWRETISSGRIIPVASGVKVGVAATVEDAAPRILGIAVRRDHEFGGRPFHSWANQAVQGIVGPSRNIEFSLTDGATEAQSILSVNGGVIVRGEAGLESAIADAGFVYIGTDTCSDDALWQFYNVSRGRDYIHIGLLRTCRFFLGKFNITVQTVDAIYQTMDRFLARLKADGDLIDYRVLFSRAQNSADELRLGRIVIDFKAEEPPVLRYIGIRSARYRQALDLLIDELARQINVTA